MLALLNDPEVIQVNGLDEDELEIQRKVSCVQDDGLKQLYSS